MVSNPQPALSGVDVDYACNVCGNRSGNRLHRAREMMYGAGEEFSFVECAGCGCLQIERVPEDLGRYYPSEYYNFKGDVESWRPGPAWRVNLKRRHASYKRGNNDLIGWLASKRFRHWTIPEWLHRIPVDTDTAILDVGCGSGGTLLTLAELGYANLTGVDPFVSKDLHYPNGVCVYKRFMSEIEGPYDVILANHVFEHMTDPEDNLRQMRRLVRPGCLIVLSIPVFSNDLWDRYGANWVALDVPRHLFVHSERSIAMLADRCGLTLEDVEYNTSLWNFTASEGYMRGIPLFDQKPEDYLTPAQIRDFASAAADVNARSRGDQATFYLRRPADA